MTQITTLKNLPAIGTPMPTRGGYFHGVTILGGHLYGEVTGPKSECEVTGLCWHPEHIEVPGATSRFDSLSNTNAMAEAVSPLALAAKACRSGGFNDWAIASPGSLLMQWDARNALPEAEAFEKSEYWSSAQYSRNYAFLQYFYNGYTNGNSKSWAGARARFVRRFLIE